MSAPSPANFSRRSSEGRRSLIRPLVRELHPYVPGEQPKVKGLIKLNTNENPYPPSPKVLRTLREAVDDRLRLYPNPTSDALREKLARFHRCSPENLIVGNGCDELLALAVRAFVEPAAAPRKAKRGIAGSQRARETVQFFAPSYSLYPVLANIHGARSKPVPLRADFGLPDPRELARAEAWQAEAALTLLTTPNAPSGRGYATAEVAQFCRAHRGVVLLDETYVDFAPEHAFRLALELPHVLVARTFSKAYSLCHLRVGYLAGPPDLIEALHRIRDSYNVNGLGQIAALATLGDLPYYRRNFRRIIATRERVRRELADRGFTILPSQTNFIFARPPRQPAKCWLDQLRARKILVRWFDHPGLRDYLRISIGSEEEMETFLRAVRAIQTA